MSYYVVSEELFDEEVDIDADDPREAASEYHRYRCRFFPTETPDVRDVWVRGQGGRGDYSRFYVTRSGKVTRVAKAKPSSSGTNVLPAQEKKAKAQTATKGGRNDSRRG